MAEIKCREVFGLWPGDYFAIVLDGEHLVIAPAGADFGSQRRKPLV